jgi:hypothetical protein
MRYRLRTLMIVLAIGPPVLAYVWWLSPMATRRSRIDDFYKAGSFTRFHSFQSSTDDEQPTENRASPLNP